ncbi:hypothetical protein FALBO_13472 [Fusarium albosuccineum]|uniref:Laccase n=1 Tax=Fusarium albosuccineum TaxID=1237068 RepID=A0A8H4P869_9HYPO|nr:hypothetical protein FALBO_13472 [Fusarium albosuccineum]
MAVDDEESHGLPQAFEVHDERAKAQAYTLKLPSRRKFCPVKRHCIMCLVAAILASALLVILYFILVSSSEQLTSPENNGTNHLAIKLNPRKHTSRSPTTLTFNWAITTGQRSPDGVEKRVYLVNDEFPGPIVESRSGDRLVIHVHNGLQEGLSLHWHGLRLKDQNLMDGAVGITQFPIPPGADFVYNFTIGDDEHGTFWWHSHSDGQRANGLWGGLVVHSPKEANPPPNDFLIMLGDWFHTSHAQVLDWFTDPRNRGNEPVPDSLLVNGRGRLNCSMAIPARPIVCSQIAVNELKPLFPPSNNALMRLRLINTGSIAGFTVGLDRGTMEPVRVDGGFNVRAESSIAVGVIYPGERLDIIAKSINKHPKARWLTIYLDDENFGYPNPTPTPNQSFPLFHNGFATRVSEIPPKANHTFIFYAKTEKLAHFDYEPVGFINHTSWKPQNPPLVAQNRPAWDENQ